MRPSSIALAFLALACAGSPASPDLTFRRIVDGGFSLLNEAGVQIVRDRPTWDTIAAKLRVDPATGNLNFASEMALVVLLGERPTGGYSVRIERIEKRDATFEVSAVEERPHASCIVSQVITSPFAVVAVAKSEGSASVHWTVTTGTPCR